MDKKKPNKVVPTSYLDFTESTIFFLSQGQESPAEIIYDSKIFFVSDSVKILSDSEALEDIR